MEIDAVVRGVDELAGSWRDQRKERLARISLDPGDFEAMAEIGLFQLAVPASLGGGWESPARSTGGLSMALRKLAAGDPSPTLVSAMHPAVLAFWLANPDPEQSAWEEQRHAVFAATAQGARWGTVTSEPGSGGDLTRTRSRAVAAPEASVDVDIPGRRYVVSGDKHFGSGTGLCSFMFTTAVPEGEDQPAGFFLDTRALLGGDALAGFEIAREWDGVGMRATQSHAVRLDECPAVRVEWGRGLDEMVFRAGPVNMCLFTSVVVGVLDEAMSLARQQLEPRSSTMRAYEQVEWSNATVDHWLAEQALDGLVRVIEAGDPLRSLHAALRAKAGVAELAERAMQRVSRVVGGGTYSRSSPFSSWFEDVRALGFLRPPWGLAYDGLFATSFS
jgi:alkylation response protein AidB-like acyl-CoA dehydrogenase